MRAIIPDQDSSQFARGITLTLAGKPIPDYTDTRGDDNQWIVITRIPMEKIRLYSSVVCCLQEELISQFHENLKSSDF